jgi:hypothetical protein
VSVIFALVLLERGMIAEKGRGLPLNFFSGLATTRSGRHLFHPLHAAFTTGAGVRLLARALAADAIHVEQRAAAGSAEVMLSHEGDVAREAVVAGPIEVSAFMLL